MNPDIDRWVRSNEARDKFRDLLDEVARDDAHIYVLRYDKPAAVIVSPQWYEEAKAQIAALGRVAKREDVSAANAEMRDELRGAARETTQTGEQS